MEPVLRDTGYAGVLLWVAGYLASMAVYFSGLDYAIRGKVVLILYPPCAAVFTYGYFSGRHLPLRYFAGVGLAWSLIAVMLDFPFIVLRFGAWQYYGPDVVLYYLAMALLPAGAGGDLNFRDYQKKRGLLRGQCTSTKSSDRKIPLTRCKPSRFISCPLQ